MAVRAWERCVVSDTGYLLGAAGAVVASAAFLVVTALNTPDVAAPSVTAPSAADQSSATTGTASPGSGSGTVSLQPVRAVPSVAAPAGSSSAAKPVASVEREPALPDDRLKAEALRAAATRTGLSNPSVGEPPRRAPASPVPSVETKNSEAKSPEAKPLTMAPAGTVLLPGVPVTVQDASRKVVSTSIPVQPGAGLTTTPLHNEPRALAIPTVAPRSVPVTVFRPASASERPATVGGETMRAKPSGSAASKSTDARKRTKSSKTKASKRTRKAANPAPVQPAASAPQPPVMGFDLIGWLRR
jgi:hypothetical protein